MQQCCNLTKKIYGVFPGHNLKSRLGNLLPADSACTVTSNFANALQMFHRVWKYSEFTDCCICSGSPVLLCICSLPSPRLDKSCRVEEQRQERLAALRLGTYQSSDPARVSSIQLLSYASRRWLGC
jgi:hypothetical protein